MDVGSISAALSAIKAASDIARSLKDADVSFEKAELKLKVAELAGALADAKIGLAETQALLQEKQTTIDELTKRLQLRGDLVRHHEAYYERNSNGEPFGDPFCSHCFESQGLGVHLNSDPMNRTMCRCPSCQNVYWRAVCPSIERK